MREKTADPPGPTTGPPSGGDESTSDGGQASGGQEGPFVIDLSLRDKNEAEEVVAGFGGSIQGGSFSAQGWTTLTNADVITIPLPSGLDATKASYTFSVTNLQFSPSDPGYGELYMLVSLDSQQIPLNWLNAGTEIRVASGYHPYSQVQPEILRTSAFFNVADPTCPSPAQCTGEARSTGNFIDGTSAFTYTHDWNGPVDHVTWQSPSKTENKTIDLSSTSPSGAIKVNQMYFHINACAGTQWDMCGWWEGPLSGGPVGVTYSDVRIVIGE